MGEPPCKIVGESHDKVCLVCTQDVETETLVISHLPISACINTIPNKIKLDKKVFPSLANSNPKGDTCCSPRVHGAQIVRGAFSLYAPQ